MCRPNVSKIKHDDNGKRFRVVVKWLQNRCCNGKSLFDLILVIDKSRNLMTECNKNDKDDKKRFFVLGK